MDIDIVTSFAVLLPLLAGLSLIDSLSFGTLAIPVWLMMTPGRLRGTRVLTYLATIGGFYFLVGLVLLAGARFASVQVEIDWTHPGIMLGVFVVGLALLVLSFVLDPPKRWRKAPQQHPSGLYARLHDWRQSAVEEQLPDGSAPTATLQRTRCGTVSLMTIAVTAGLLEVATMLPYLAAIGLLTASAPALELSFLDSAGLLAAYCVVMLLPALLLFAGRALAKQTVTPVLSRIDGWFAEHGQSTVAWVLGALGVVLMLNTWPAVQSALAG